MFPHYLKKGSIFEKKISEDKACVLFSTTFVWNIFNSKKSLARIIKYIYILVSLPRNYPSFLSDFSESLIFSTYSKNTQISNFLEIRLVAAELFQSDRLDEGKSHF
jgi:hypothetical protein